MDFDAPDLMIQLEFLMEHPTEKLRSNIFPAKFS